MIKLYDGQITDLLPEKIASDTEVQCISYAIQMELQRFMELTDKTRTLSMIDTLPEEILDVLAVELRTPYYQQDMDLESKRSIIKKTLLWYTKAGTPSAVAELVEIVFGEGSVVEWFDFTEAPYTPGTFDIITDAQMTEDAAEYFLSIVQRVKNTRSHIRRILIDREADLTVYAGLNANASPHVTITNSPQLERTVTAASYGAAAAVTTTKTTVYNGAA